MKRWLLAALLGWSLGAQALPSFAEFRAAQKVSDVPDRRRAALPIPSERLDELLAAALVG